MDIQLTSAIVGAAIALVGGVIGALLQHFLSLRADRIKMEREKKEREAEEIRKSLSLEAGVSYSALVAASGAIAGRHSVAAGAGGLAVIGGDVQGDVVIDEAMISPKEGQDQTPSV